MKKVYLAVALSLLVLSAAGCQKTPEQAIVVGKSNDALIEKAQDLSESETGSVSDRVGLTSETLPPPPAAQEQEQEPDAGDDASPAAYRYQDSFANQDGSITVTVDAEVIAPEADSAAIIRVTDGTITQAQADVLMEELVHTPLHDPHAPVTKDAIMEQILENKRLLAEGPTEEDLKFGHIDANGNALTWEQWMQQYIDQLQEEYNNAPEENEQAAISGQFVEKDGLSFIEGVGYSEEYGYESLQIQNIITSLGASRALYDRNSAVKEAYILLGSSIQYADVTSRELPELTISAGDARTLTDPLVEKLGIDNMAFYAARKGYRAENERWPERDFWVVLYTRSFNGLPITYTSATGDMMTDAAVYNEPWRYETLAFFVNDSGIVGMHWEAPYTIGDAVTEDSALLRFEDVADIFQKMYLVDNDGQKQTVTVDRICLGYTRIAEQDKEGSGILVPAWDFFGTVTDENGNTTADPYRSLLTINAIDGSIISRDMGY